MNTQTRIVRWLLFSVLLGLVPFVMAFVTKAISGSTLSEPGALIERGELLLVAVALSGGAIGELIGRGGKWPTGEIVSVAFCIIALALAAFSYGLIQAFYGTGSHPNVNFVIYGSTALFVLIILSGLGCVALAKE